MSIIYVLIPLAIIIILIAIGVFFWAVKSDQFNDLERQGYNILFDEENIPPKDAQAQVKDSTTKNKNVEDKHPTVNKP
ncbi:cbb3-type cytochrome oxidase assembly protein CcoS [Alteromonas sp. a30]|uniref:cbb3-type cytochrome oxidase assembly protein CcoS n=1 Tax=Alteromonas sp. a30 TaxID=2730917 RepID=UPI00227EDAEC|nr:cbb3-type cytochrome oxidase assembly protein CcoS [Alteromonas sp. a30]MCY7293868.1 cbb3-type cytochrome oxidase assembly protein CcoS [Alteromonas sp. a30]